MTLSFLVTGATGRQGGSVTRELLSKGATVHALVRNPESATARDIQSLGAKIFKGDFLDVASVEKAAVGVTGIFLNPMMQLEPPDTQLQQARNVIAAAERNLTVKTIVVSTVIVANRHDEWLARDPNYFLAPFYGPKDMVEKAVRSAKIENYTILRPGWLMSNYVAPYPSFHWPEYQSHHLMTVSYPPATKLGHASPGDVGKFAAAALLNPENFNGHEVDLASENLTLDDVAKLLSTAAGVTIQTKFRTPEETAEMDSMKLPGFGYQIYMAQNPGVYEVDLAQLEKYSIQLTSFAEFYEDEGERTALRATLGM
jgi:uncharacterized protein YbjT (DUF2867 family)